MTNLPENRIAPPIGGTEIVEKLFQEKPHGCRLTADGSGLLPGINCGRKEKKEGRKWREWCKGKQQQKNDKGSGNNVAQCRRRGISGRPGSHQPSSPGTNLSPLASCAALRSSSSPDPNSRPPQSSGNPFSGEKK